MDGRIRIILYDTNVINLMIGKEALSGCFDVLTVPSGKKLFCALGIFKPDMILVNVNASDDEGMEAIQQLKSDPGTVDIPLLFLAAQDDRESQEKGLCLGAADYITKPYTAAMLLYAIERHLMLAAQQKEISRYKEAAERYIMQKNTPLPELEGSRFHHLLASTDCRIYESDKLSVGDYRCYLIAMIDEMQRRGIYSHELSLMDKDIFVDSAKLHDIGNMVVRDDILEKPGKLTNEEYDQVKGHTVFGVKVIEEFENDTGKREFFDNAKLFAASHHERWDGSGYPLGLREREIPLQGRLMAVIDVYNALVSERSYKRAHSHETAREIIKKSRGIHFDPLLVDIFLSVSDKFAEIRKSNNCIV